MTELTPEQRRRRYKKIPVVRLLIETLEGTFTARYGDYVIRGVAGEFYRCDPDIFRRTYELGKQPDRLGGAGQ